MRRTIMAAALAGVGAVALFLVLKPAPLPAGPENAGPASSPALKSAAPPLPVAQVVLFSSGVGYFQREGEIDGNARVDLTFPVQDINDLLKSMVLQDLGGGHVSAVSYDSHDPIDKTLKSFAINLTTNPSLAQILNQARGEKVEVVLQQTASAQPGTLTGAVIGIEHQRQQVGKESFVDSDVLNLWCAEGVRSVKLADVQRVRFLNPVLDSEFRRALEVLALSHDTQKKAVSLSFAGDGKRSVRVGYVIENPIWKTSYRLVLGKDGKPFLQGWAIVENPSDEDWNNVHMALVSGRPISFQMDLYQPLYVSRPVVEPELFASLRPPTYSGAMDKGRDWKEFRPPAKEDFKPEPADRKAEEGEKLEKKEAWGKIPARQRVVKDLEDAISIQKSVQAAATAEQLGDFYQYVVEKPVNLPRQKSALLPIVNKAVEGTRVSIYNPNVHGKFALLGLRFKNTSGLHLMQGPITVFEGSNYAGDARILDLQPGEERLLSYAIDLGTEVEAITWRTADRLTAVKINKGVLRSTTKLRENTKYTVKNRSEQDRVVLLEHAFRPEFKLVTPEKPSERARDVYRFEVKVAAGKTTSQEVVEEQDLVQEAALTSADDDTVRHFFSAPVSSDKVKAALAKALELRNKLSVTQREIQQQERELKTITEDQTRLRANLKEMPQTAAAYKRYLEKFDKQETEIENYQAQIKKSQATEHQQRKEYEAYLAELTVE